MRPTSTFYRRILANHHQVPNGPTAVNPTQATHLWDPVTWGTSYIKCRAFLLSLLKERERERKGGWVFWNHSFLFCFFLWTIFQKNTKSFPFGDFRLVKKKRTGDKMDEWQIDGFWPSAGVETKWEIKKNVANCPKLLLNDGYVHIAWHCWWGQCQGGVWFFGCDAIGNVDGHDY